MNDETNREVVSIVFQASKLTLEAFLEALEKGRNKINEIGSNEKRGHMKLNELLDKGDGVKSIELPDNGIKDFKRCASKYNVDFSIKKDKTTDPPTYYAFFKGKDTDVISQAFREFTKKYDKKEQRRSTKEEIKEAKVEAKKRNQENKTNERQRGKERVKQPKAKEFSL